MVLNGKSEHDIRAELGVTVAFELLRDIYTYIYFCWATGHISVVMS